MWKRRFFRLLWVCLVLQSCGTKHEKSRLFQEVSDESGVIFSNDLVYTEEFNPYTYRNFYNGGGVALGDVNNDGLLDIYFTGNIVNNKLFLNKGDWKFEEIAESAGVSCPDVWSSGAAFADINGDGFTDIYVCKSGKPEGSNRHNELFINNGDLTFREASREYGLDITGLSTHAAFFDFDLDGDLDCYLLTNSIRSVGVGYDLIVDQRQTPDPEGGGNKFFSNDNGYFTDVTEELGIYSSAIGFGLGITISDFNNDQYPDIFISNDFFEKDYLYVNNQGESFTESLEQYFQSISMGSMGADVGDLDNDLLPDLMVTEMLPATVQRKKTKAVFESWDKYSLAVDKGYFHQYPRNALQRNIGQNKFVELSRQADMAATEWSWGSLIFDMNNDGLKDIFVANGIYKDLLDRDYLTYMANEANVKKILQEKGSVITELIDIMPSSPVANFAYVNRGDFQFENVAAKWNLDQPSFSNGSAYGDMDNDGDLDLVVNNVNMQSFVYRNNTDTSTNRSLRVRLIGTEKNTAAIGTRVIAYAGQQKKVVENYPSRGFESSVDPVLHIGLGNIRTVDSLVVIWPDRSFQKLYDVPANSYLEIKKETDKKSIKTNLSQHKLPFLGRSTVNIPYEHQENEFVDFDRDRLLPHMYDNDGPALSIGDVNGDGLEDVFVGGAKGYAGKLMLQQNQTFVEGKNTFLEEHKISEDVCSLFFDCDGDGDLDLYVASGGKAFSASSSALTDRLYMNDGSGNFSWNRSALPFSRYFSTSVVIDQDFDNDGDIDLFVGERFHPFYYGQKVSGYLLVNDGQGNFDNKTAEIAPGLMDMDMITDAIWTDYNSDGLPDLIISTDWGPIKLFENNNGVFTDMTARQQLDKHKGWWKTLIARDIDNDGDPDIIAGNHGQNSFFKDSIRMYIDDFDQNSSFDYIMCQLEKGKYYPVVDRNELIAQLPVLKKKILYFKDYADMNMEDLFTPEQLEKACVLEATVMSSSVFRNEGDHFIRESLPLALQYSPVYAITSVDVDGDDQEDLLFGGNQYLVKPQFGRYDAMPISVLICDGKGAFQEKDVRLTAFFGEARNIGTVTTEKGKLIIVGYNNSPVEAYEILQ